MTNAAEMIAGGGLLLLFHLVVDTRGIGPVTLSSLGALLYLAVVGGVVVYSAYMYLLHHVSSTLATSYAYVNPLVAVGLGVAVGGEHPSLIGLLALLVILVGAGTILLKSPGTETVSHT
jgi:drug/metabolite transporter (DMT)-like permease